MRLTRSSVELIDPADAPAWVYDIDTYMYSVLALVTVLVYDAIITMDKEIKYFWSSPWKFVSLIYFLNRFIGLFGAFVFLWRNTYHANETLCSFTDWTKYLADCLTILFIEYILYMRVMALYSQNKRLSIFLQSLFAVEAAFMLGNFLYGIISEKISVGGLARGITVCGVDSNFPVFWQALYWTAPVVYELILMALAVYKTAEFWRTSAGFKGFILVKVLIQDQILYFIVVIACSLMQIITFRSSLNPAFANFLDTVGNASFLCVIGSRLLIHLKEVGGRNVDGATVVSYSLRTIC